MPIHFHNADRSPSLSQRRLLKAFLITTLKAHRAFDTAEVNYVFCSDDYLLAINREFLSHDTYTDIITFDLSENNQHLQAEIYISTDRVKDNARRFGVPFRQEILRVVFHGMLHLCGFKDKTTAQQRTMREMEEQCLIQFLNTSPQA